MRKLYFEVLENMNFAETAREYARKLCLPVATVMLFMTLNITEAWAQKFGLKFPKDFATRYKQTHPEFDGIGGVNDTDIDGPGPDPEADEHEHGFQCAWAVLSPSDRVIRQAFRGTEARRTYRDRIGAISSRYNIDLATNTATEVQDRSNVYSWKLVLFVDQSFLDTKLDWSASSAKAITYINNTLSKINAKESAINSAWGNNTVAVSMCELIVIPDQSDMTQSLTFCNDLMYDINWDPLWDKSFHFWTHRFPWVYTTLYILPNENLLGYHPDWGSWTYSATHTWANDLAEGHEASHVAWHQYQNSDPNHNGLATSYMNATPTQNNTLPSDITSRNAVNPASFINGACGVSLPIELATFMVENNNCETVTVRRTTLSEIDSKQFILQVSSDGIKRTTVMTVDWAWDSQVQKDYEVVMNMNDFKAWWFNQLWLQYVRVADEDNEWWIRFHHAETLDLRKCALYWVEMYPTLFSSTWWTLTITNIPESSEKWINISIVDAAWRLVFDKQIENIEQEREQVTLNFNAAGVYTIRFWLWNNYIDKKIVVQ